MCINCGPVRAIDTFVSVSVHPDYGQFELIWISLELFVKLFCNYRFGFELLLISPHWVWMGSFFNGRQVKGDLIWTFKTNRPENMTFKDDATRQTDGAMNYCN